MRWACEDEVVRQIQWAGVLLRVAEGPRISRLQQLLPARSELWADIREETLDVREVREDVDQGDDVVGTDEGRQGLVGHVQATCVRCSLFTSMGSIPSRRLPSGTTCCALSSTSP